MTTSRIGQHTGFSRLQIQIEGRVVANELHGGCAFVEANSLFEGSSGDGKLESLARRLTLRSRDFRVVLMWLLDSHATFTTLVNVTEVDFQATSLIRDFGTCVSLKLLNSSTWACWSDDKPSTLCPGSKAADGVSIEWPLELLALPLLNSRWVEHRDSCGLHPSVRGYNTERRKRTG
jgi:hypothetical protein